MDNSDYLDEFQEILQSEVYVDLERLRMLSKHGIPEQIRGEVWKYLLGVQQADRSKELSLCKERLDEYNQIDKTDHEIAKRIIREVSRYKRRVKEFENIPESKFTNIIISYLTSNRDIEYTSDLIPLCAPFIFVLDTEFDAYFCFEKFMDLIQEYNSSINLKQQLAYFITLFRYALPELSNYFDDEQVNLTDWLASWLQTLLSKELKFENLIRLWDTYFSVNDPFLFHPFICLSILLCIKESLEDLEQSEIRTMLLRLPLLNIEMIIADAYNFKHETIQKQMNGELL